MRHEYTARDWVWEPDEADTADEADDELPEFLNEETETANELVTDGGDES